MKQGNTGTRKQIKKTLQYYFRQFVSISFDAPCTVLFSVQALRKLVRRITQLQSQKGP